MTLNGDEMADSGPIAQAWRDAAGEIETKTQVLWRYLKPERFEGKYIGAFSSEAEPIIKGIQEAEARLADVETDSKTLVELMGEYKTIRELAQALHREQMKISNSEHDCQIIFRRELLANHNMSPEEVKALDSVRNQSLLRDKIVLEAEPILKDLQDRMHKAKIILSKYN
jgi:hypothetical protein